MILDNMNIEQVLGLVLKLESQSKDIVDKATERRNTLPKRMEAKLAEMRTKYMGDADKRIALIRTDEAKRLEDELAVIRNSHEADMKRLSDAAEREIDNWAELIFKNVVNSEQS